MQNIKYKMGISMLMLLVTIVIMIVLVSTIVISYNSIISSTHRKEFGKEIYTIGQLIDQYYFMNNKYPLSEEITVDLATLNQTYKTQFSGEIGYDTGTVTLKKVNLYEAGVQSVKRGTMENGDTTDVYAYSITTGKVYYIKGVKIAKVIYYTLTDELKKELDLI